MSARNLIITAALLLVAGAAHARKSPYDGRLEVKNDRAYPITLSIDGEAFGRVQPHSRRVVRHVPNGVRFVAVGCSIGGTLDEKVAVPVRGLARMRVAPLFGQAQIENRTGTRMKVFIDGEKVGFMRTGRDFTTERMKPGRHTIELQPVAAPFDGGPRMRKTITVRAGVTQPVRFGTYAASLTVRNSGRRAARLFIDGKRMERIEPGRTRTVTNLVPGRVKVELRRRHQRVVSSTRLTLSPGEKAQWNPQPPVMRDGDLLVSNGDRRHVRVLLDGREIARLGRDESRLVRDVRRGRHRVTVVYANGQQVEHRLDMDSHREAFAVRPQARPSRYASRW